MGLKSASVFIKIAVLVSILAVLFHLIGYGSNSWQKSELGGRIVAEEGLWSTCNYVLNLGCGEYTVTATTKEADELRTVRALCTIALIMLFVVAVVTFLSMCLKFLRNKLFGFLNMVTAFAAGGLIIVAVIIYGSDLIPGNNNVTASWSLYLSVIGAALSIGAGVLIGLGVFCGGSSSSDSS